MVIAHHDNVASSQLSVLGRPLAEYVPAPPPSGELCFQESHLGGLLAQGIFILDEVFLHILKVVSL